MTAPTFPEGFLWGAATAAHQIEGSPLAAIGLVKGDVVTRLDNDSVSSFDVLERHERNTLIRYIKSGTTKVRQDRIYIPADDEMPVLEDETYYAP